MIANLVAPTLLVRKVMYRLGRALVYTNNYAKCHTVKCYKFADESENVIACLRISNTLKNLGIKDFTIKTTSRRSPYGRNGAIIVRIPK